MKRILGLLMVALSLAACDRSVNVQRGETGGVDVTVTVNEAEVNELIDLALAQATENGRLPRTQNLGADLQSGSIVLTGEFERENGTGNFVNGTLTLSVAMVDGKLDLQATDAAIDGFEATDERLTEITQRIEDALNSRLQRDHGVNISLKSVNVTDSELSFVLNVTR